MSDSGQEDAELRSELLARAEADQRVRKGLDFDTATDSQWDELARVDADNTRFLTDVIERYGWPGEHLVGPDGADAAWLLAQHAGHEYRVEWLPLLRAAVAATDASPWHLAYVEDRINVYSAKPQRYGTQWCLIDGTHRLAPLAGASEVNTLRVRVGLDPLPETDIGDAVTDFSELT